jgi:hypothetical protein
METSGNPCKEKRASFLPGLVTSLTCRIGRALGNSLISACLRKSGERLDGGREHDHDPVVVIVQVIVPCEGLDLVFTMPHGRPMSVRRWPTKAYRRPASRPWGKTEDTYRALSVSGQCDKSRPSWPREGAAGWAAGVATEVPAPLWLAALGFSLSNGHYGKFGWIRAGGETVVMEEDLAETAAWRKAEKTKRAR